MLASYKRYLVGTGYDIIVDNPYETKEDLLETIELLDKIPGPFTLNIFGLQFQPGTELMRKAIEDGVYDAESHSQKHHNVYRATYLNLIITLYAIFKVPSWLLRRLLKSKKVDSDSTYPTVGRVLFWLTLVRRGIAHTRRGDFSLVPGKWAVAISRISVHMLKRGCRELSDAVELSPEKAVSGRVHLATEAPPSPEKAVSGKVPQTTEGSTVNI
jgi:hypothetical protein